MKSSAQNAGLTAYEDLFKDDATRETDNAERVMELPLNELFTPKDHPFRVSEDDAMREMADSIVKFGVLTPGIVRPRAEGGYELLSGNRRKLASYLAGKTTMPVVVREMDDVCILRHSAGNSHNIRPLIRMYPASYPHRHRPKAGKADRNKLCKVFHSIA